MDTPFPSAAAPIRVGIMSHFEAFFHFWLGVMVVQGRKILRVDSSGVTVAREARFESEAQLHRAIAEHPEVLPNEEFGLGSLVPLANELDLGGGPMDLLVGDSLGRLAIVEFKRGTENPDVRQVVAQILEYGATLWRHDYDALEERCRQCAPGFPGSLTDHVFEHLAALDEPFDADTFRDGVTACLEAGTFVFVYCGRDLDDRTRRIMTYLAEGPRMSFFAVEVDYYRGTTGEDAVMVPRTAFVPSWITGPAPAPRPGARPKATFSDAPPEFVELVARIDEVAKEMSLQKSRRSTGWSYLPPVLEDDVRHATSGVGVYATGRGVEFNMLTLRDLGKGQVADDILGRLEAITSVNMRRARDWPSVSCASLVPNWERVRAEVIEPYFRARGAASRM